MSYDIKTIRMEGGCVSEVEIHRRIVWACDTIDSLRKSLSAAKEEGRREMAREVMQAREDGLRGFDGWLEQQAKGGA